MWLIALLGNEIRYRVISRLLRRPVEARRAVDHPEHPHDPLDPVEIAELGLERRQHREPGHPRRLARLLQAEVGADLAGDPPLSILRAVAADPDQVAVDDAAEVVPYGWEHRRQHDPQLPHPLGDHPATTSRSTQQSSHSTRSTVTAE